MASRSAHHKNFLSRPARLTRDGMSDATQLIQAINRGDKQATAELLPLVYDELKRLARARAPRTRCKPPLVHEAYL
jgi:ECF sigma factor